MVGSAPRRDDKLGRLLVEVVDASLSSGCHIYKLTRHPTAVQHEGQKTKKKDKTSQLCSRKRNRRNYSNSDYLVVEEIRYDMRWLGMELSWELGSYQDAATPYGRYLDSRYALQ